MFICIVFQFETATNIIKIDKTMVKVITRHGEHRVLEKIFNVSHVTVRRALNGETNTALAQRIRTAAIKRGARVMVEKDSESDCHKVLFN